MKTNSNFKLKETLFQGAVAGFVSLSVSAIGMVSLFGTRFLIAGLLTMGQILFLMAPVIFSFVAARKATRDRKLGGFGQALIIGGVSSLFLIALIWSTQIYDVRSIFLNVSPALINVLTFGLGPVTGSLVLLGVTLAACLLAAGIRFLPRSIANPLLSALLTTLVVGLLSEILAERVRNFFGNNAVQAIFRSRVLQPIPALVLFLGAAGIFSLRQFLSQQKIKGTRSETTTKPAWIRYIRLLATSAALLLLPLALGTYLTEVTNNVGIFLLMGLGLNIVVGLAGLLDLGYVAFFAFGAYSMAVLTSLGQLGTLEMSFWVALPICVAISAFAGLFLGMPVLRMRGDYLAIVTLGFGEIIRILALSDLLKPVIGGAQGILQIPKPSLAGISLVQPEQLYYVVLGAVLLAAFVSIRLRDSRLGRRWVALREDEDVAQAAGINLVSTKLLAFAIGAAFSGLAGAIFASKLTSIFPHSFSLLISINVLSLIIVGGLGSIPGTIVGAAILVGLPELLREFQEFRLLMYGVLLIVMMLTRPEGFIPSSIIKRELHSDDETVDEVPAAGVAVQA